MLLTAQPPNPLTAQGTVDQLALRLSAMTAVSGYEQAMADSIALLFPGQAVIDRVGNVVVTLGRGAPRRLVACALDEPGYVVGNVTDDGWLTLRRVGRDTTRLFDQQNLEGHRVTLFGTRGPVPGVAAVRSTHLTRGRPQTTEAPFTVDNAYVDVGATSRADVQALGLSILTPVATLKQPQRYGSGLVAAPSAGRRAACAALAAAVQAKPGVKGTVVVAFTVQSLQASDAGLESVKRLAGPFTEVSVVTVPSRFPDTPVETVALADVRVVMQRVVEWMGGGR
jgi:putative aminopeptidase FrvX